MTTLDRPVDGGHQPVRGPAEDVLTPTWRRLSRAWGPGPVTGVYDDEPPRIATLPRRACSSGRPLLWTVLFHPPLMMAVQATGRPRQTQRNRMYARLPSRSLDK